MWFVQCCQLPAINIPMQNGTKLNLVCRVIFFFCAVMKSEHGKTNASRLVRSQLHLSAGAATKRRPYVTDLSQLQGAPKVTSVLETSYIVAKASAVAYFKVLS
jgi:hypothetical protein